MHEPIEEPIVKRYDGELSDLDAVLLSMGRLVLEQVADALTAFKGRDLPLAHEVMARDREVDRLEIAADDAIVTLIGRRSPVGKELRRIMAVSKSVSDLERIGDEAAKIAAAAIQLFDPKGHDPGSHFLRHINGMAALATGSLQSAVDLFEVWSEKQARALIAGRREMDEEFQADLRRLMTYVMEDTRTVGFAIGVVLVIKSLERIGHHAQNLAEHAIFQAQGEDARPHDC